MLRNNRNYLLYTILAIANNNIIEKVEVKILNSTFLLFLIKKVATLLVQGALFFFTVPKLLLPLDNPSNKFHSRNNT